MGDYIDLIKIAKKDVKNNNECSYKAKKDVTLDFCCYYLDFCELIETCPYKRRKKENEKM